MGSILLAKCECGFEKEFAFGAGMIDHLFNSSVPGYDFDIKEFVVLNKMDPESIPKSVKFYSDPAMYKGKLKESAHQWGDTYLSPENNFCPACNEFTMKFLGIGVFD